MNPLKFYKELIARYSLARWLSVIFIIAVVLLGSFLVGYNAKKQPVINSIDPAVGLPGDRLTIYGENFGNIRDNSYVEFAGSRLTSSGYISWSDTKIELVLPSNVQDGLVVVGTNSGRSEPSFFANKAGIPQTVRVDPQVVLPVIESVSPATASVGQLVTITGTNFGSVRGSSVVLFSASRENGGGSSNQNNYAISTDESDYIAANEMDYDYELWSDTEIHVRVPDGACTGQLYVKTSKGGSDFSAFTVSTPAGKKTFGSKRTYVVQLSADITTGILESGSDSSVTLYIPRPPVTSMQPESVLNDYSPEPLIKNDARDIIYQSDLVSLSAGRQRFSQNFVITVYDVNTQIKEQSVTRFASTQRLLYSTNTAGDSYIPSNSPLVTELKDSIIGRERNPYKQAKLIYNYMIDNYELMEKVREGNVSIMDLVQDKKGDAYDFTMLFVALCRSAGIPAVPLSGVLVENSYSSMNHWWAEIYIENFGWVPVDVALGAGMVFNNHSHVEDARQYYFGNLDNQHVAISRGWNVIKSSLLNSRTVFRPRTYALQSVWEEASNSANYSSLWNNPVIIGIY